MMRLDTLSGLHYSMINYHYEVMYLIHQSVRLEYKTLSSYANACDALTNHKFRINTQTLSMVNRTHT